MSEIKVVPKYPALAPAGQVYVVDDGEVVLAKVLAYREGQMKVDLGHINGESSTYLSDVSIFETYTAYESALLVLRLDKETEYDEVKAKYNRVKDEYERVRAGLDASTIQLMNLRKHVEDGGD